jgi:hypothetical protein
MDASRFGANAALASPYTDQFALEFREATEDREHQAAVRRGRIGPGVTLRPGIWLSSTNARPCRAPQA